MKMYLPFFKASIKTELAYKAQIVMWIFIAFVETLFVVFLYNAIYRNSPDGVNSVINGFTFYEMILYMITSFFFSYIMGGGDTDYEIATDIREGTIANTLTKPVSYRMRHVFSNFGSFAFSYVIIVIPFLTIVYGIFIGLGLHKVEAGEFIVSVLLFLLFSILASFISNGIAYFIGMLVFYTDHLFGLSMAKNAIQGFLGGQMVPLSYMGKLGVVFSFTPFAFLNSTPVLILMGKMSILQTINYIFIALIWIFVIEMANYLIFKRALHKLTVQGG